MLRRDFVQDSARTLSAALAAVTFTGWEHVLQAEQESLAPGKLRLASFRFDVTSPVGSALCGGLVKPVETVDDPLEAIGLVLLGAGQPIVLCAVDWCGILNESHAEWRAALAAGVGTTPDRVCVHTVHQHDAPFDCVESQALAATQVDLPQVTDVEFHKVCLQRARAAVAAAIPAARGVTHVAHGQAKVERVASNRRIVGEDGKISDWRGSSSKNPRHAELPEGLIDPFLKTVIFYDGETRLAACHYYATHPMSFYGQGRVSSDFAGLARKQRQQADPGCTHLYFTGCSGNIAAGKYNNGTPESRLALTERMHAALVASESDMKKTPVDSLAWKTANVAVKSRDTLVEADLLRIMADPAAARPVRIRATFMLTWLRRCARQLPIAVSALHIGPVTLLHLPGESFVEYQLRAQQLAPSQFVATAAYGDDGPWYIPTAEAYPQGGYEVSVAFSDPAIDGALGDGLKGIV